MKTTAKALTTAVQAAPNQNEHRCPRVYRLRKCFAVVQFDAGAKGRIVFLPHGTELCVLGSSRLDKCLEVQWQNQRYNIFKVDLLGPWAVPIGDSRPIAPGRAAMAARASA